MIGVIQLSAWDIDTVKRRAYAGQGSATQLFLKGFQKTVVTLKDMDGIKSPGTTSVASHTTWSLTIWKSRASYRRANRNSILPLRSGSAKLIIHESAETVALQNVIAGCEWIESIPLRKRRVNSRKAWAPLCWVRRSVFLLLLHIIQRFSCRYQAWFAACSRTLMVESLFTFRFNTF